MDKKKFLKIFEMAIESEEITEITLKILGLMGPEYITFKREKFNEMYEYYKNNSDEIMQLKPYYINQVREIGITSKDTGEINFIRFKYCPECGRKIY